jgi:arylsulfatase A-like enzyme
VRFDRAYVTTAICSPSRAACLSGRYGSRNGVPTLGDPLKFPKATFAHDLSAAGYRTAQAGKWHLGTSPPAAGFSSHARIHGNGSWFNRKIDTNIPGAPKDLGGRFYEDVMADVVTGWIGDHVDRHPDTPFLMWWCNQVPHLDGRLQYPDVMNVPKGKGPHVPAGSEGGYQSWYDVARLPVPGNWGDSLKTKPPYLTGSGFITKAIEENYGGPGGYGNPAPGVRNKTLGQDHVQQHLLEYYAAISAMDAQIGRVLTGLKDPDRDGDPSDSILEDTWVIFMGDNGWQTASHGFTSKVLAYEESSRVPLIVKGPGLRPRVDDSLVLNIDLTRLIYGIYGLDAPAYLQGADLLKLLEDPATPWRDQIYYEALTSATLDAWPHDAVVTDRYKFIRTYSTTAGAKANKGVVFEELYDLKDDPVELHNLAEQPAHQVRKAELAARLEKEKAAIATSPDPVRRK